MNISTNSCTIQCFNNNAQLYFPISIDRFKNVAFVPGAVLYLLDVCDWILYKVSPICAVGVTLVSIYWTLVTYGAITVMQVFLKAVLIDIYVVQIAKWSSVDISISFIWTINIFD